MGRLPRFKNQLKMKHFPALEKSHRKVNSNNMLELRTGKSHIIRILLECIKYIINEANIVFSPDSSTQHQNCEKDSITLSISDRSESVVVFIELKGNEFEHYFCDNKLVVGVNILELFKVIKTVENDDIITIHMENNNSNYLFITTENPKTGQISNTSIQTIDKETEALQIPEMEFDLHMVIPSQRFQKICKDFLGFKIEQIEISVSETHISFNSAGYNECSRNVTASCIEQTDDTDNETEESNGIVFSNHNTKYKGKFILKYFEHFIKATPLSEKVTIYFKKDTALMIRYNVVDVGDMSFILFPIKDEE